MFSCHKSLMLFPFSYAVERLWLHKLQLHLFPRNLFYIIFNRFHYKFSSLFYWFVFHSNDFNWHSLPADDDLALVMWKLERSIDMNLWIQSLACTQRIKCCNATLKTLRFIFFRFKCSVIYVHIPKSLFIINVHTHQKLQFQV